MQVVPLIAQRVVEQAVVLVLVFDWHARRVAGCVLNRTSLQPVVLGGIHLGRRSHADIVVSRVKHLVSTLSILEHLYEVASSIYLSNPEILICNDSAGPSCALCRALGCAFGAGLCTGGYATAAQGTHSCACCTTCSQTQGKAADNPAPLTQGHGSQC